jgi:Dolichyl-phosphate-mannose-protein mannosyltransferase
MHINPQQGISTFAGDNTNQKRPEHRMKRFISGKEEYLLALLLFVTACTAGILLHRFDKYAFYYFGDAASHIIKAREFTDSHPHEIPIIGTVWLPLPHFLLLPFASIDSLFFSGIAGAFVGIPCLVGTGVFLFLLVKKITGSAPVAFLMASLYGLNPNVVYMSLTPMDEPSLIFFITVAGYALYRWLSDESRTWFFLCAVAVMLATLCRYEAWPLAALVVFVGMSKAASRWRGGQKPEAIRIAAISALSCAGLVLWFSWHFIVFGNPFEFARGTYSVLSTVYRESSQRLPVNIVKTFSRAILIIFGPVLLLAAGAALISHRQKRVDRKVLLLLLFFILPMLFTLTAAIKGYVGIDEWWWNWRYVLTFGLFLTVAGGAGLLEIFGRTSNVGQRSVVIAGLLAMPLIQLAMPSVGVAVYKDAAKCIDATVRDAMFAGEHLPVVYKSGSIGLITNGAYTVRIQISSSLPLKNFRIIHFSAGQKIEDSTLFHEHYLVVQKNEAPESELINPSTYGERSLLTNNFEVRFENASFALLERKTTTDELTTPP